MDESTKTIPEMLREYNALALVAANLGLAYRERKCFKDRNDAVRSLDAVNSSLRAAKGAQQGRPEATPAEPADVNLAAPAADNAAVAVDTEEAAVAKKEKTKRTPKAKVANGNGEYKPRKDSKMEVLYRMLTRKSGCTRAQVLIETGWKAVSMQQISAHLGLKLSQTKEKGSVTTYFGE